MSPVELDAKMSKVLLLIDGADGPIGSRQLVGELSQLGVEFSEATMARRLRELDAMGLTVKVGAKGRTPSKDGRALALSIRHGAETIEKVRDATVVRTTDNLLNLLRARRAVEPEAVRDATRSLMASGGTLQQLVDDHRQKATPDGVIPRVVALNFHREIMRHTTNPVLKAMLGIVFNESMDIVERTLDVILAAHHRNAASVDEHAAITAAVIAGDDERAAELMYAHLDRLISEVLRFIDEHDGTLIERLLASGSA
ncbi:FCD domain-containing protein [Mycolicibacterium farcinogenes]|nr:FCD domain-containing protein [Mycolicibacterium farcinogenes]